MKISKELKNKIRTQTLSELEIDEIRPIEDKTKSNSAVLVNGLWWYYDNTGYPVGPYLSESIALDEQDWINSIIYGYCYE